ncbi:ABC transporter permease subunit [Metaclostridioides mangenotii]|uniref:ABC-type transport system involved in multi-copper enzyme maturation permease subunit n=1 Tax=Metaclostridioides mangenotii TaxID=1540 RepID=A0ABS4EAN3_9FIRM|nr:ABC transporter permease subunit [Clostridioides mangenotii]MBP1855000.1 ABC-type transport system involved in multi-copper enzyme maturation permease subunit [Clostridioides mangenotii]
MLDLIKFELYKIFSKKSVIIVLILTVLFSIFNVVGQSVYLKFKGLDSIDDAYSVMKEHEGKVITQEERSNLEKIAENIVQKEKSGKKLTKEEVVYKHYLYDAIVNPEPTYIVDNQYYKLNEMKGEIIKLEKENKIDTYEYKNLNYIYGKVKNVEEPKSYFTYGWNTTTDFKVIATLISILIVVGLAPIFSDEYQSNSAQIMLSCRNGKNKLVLSKILSGLIFTAIVFIIINSIYMMSALRYDFIGWDKPLELFKYYRLTPFDMRIIDFYVIGLGISFIGATLFALVTMLMSLLVKNNMISLLFSLGMYYVPMLLSDFIPIAVLSRVFKEINLAESIKVEGMFIYPNTYNIFGNPTLYSTVLISLVAVSIPVVIYLIKYLGKKQAI